MTNCECADPHCECRGKCIVIAEFVVRRIDMDDATGTPMCAHCTSDALDSGLFDIVPNYQRPTA